MKIYDQILLEEDQKDLLEKFVEAERSVPKGKRGKFFAVQSLGRATAEFINSGGQAARFDGSLTDAEILASKGLLGVSFGSRGTPQFYVLPEGYLYYEEMMVTETPAERTEDSIKHYLNSEELKSRFPAAFAKWRDADSLLWKSDSATQLSTIGHLCREAMQEFVDAIVADNKLQPHVSDKAKTVARLRKVIELLQDDLGTTEREFLNTLLTYWGSVSDLAQRQEHGAQKEGKSLEWEDGRRLVFQSLVIMYEIVWSPLVKP